jgi:hypothetical protein
MQQIEANGQKSKTARELCAKRIRELIQDWVNDLIALGRELKAARNTFPVTGRTANKDIRAGWPEWIKTEIGISLHYATELIRLADFIIGNGIAVEGLGLGFTVLRVICSERTPEQARQEIIDLAQAGEIVGESRAKHIVQQYLPTPKEANQEARETHRPVLAKDGYLYFGGTKEEIAAGTERRTIVYAVRRAVETLSDLGMTPHQFLQYALPHQLWQANEVPQIKQAAGWLHALQVVLERSEFAHKGADNEYRTELADNSPKYRLWQLCTAIETSLDKLEGVDRNTVSERYEALVSEFNDLKNWADNRLIWAEEDKAEEAEEVA